MTSKKISKIRWNYFKAYFESIKLTIQNNSKSLLVLLLLFCNLFTYTQQQINSKHDELTMVQNLKGTIVDRVLQTPINGATIKLIDANRSVTSDSNGNFSFPHVLIGV